jgi:hypothetical protein
MSERMSGWIQIGGTLPRSHAEQLCSAISTDRVSLEWGDATFEPKSPEELMAARKDGRLWLCDNEASWGEFPDLEQTCRDLGLAYTRCSDGASMYDAERVDWRPEMKAPLSRICSNESGEKILVAEEPARNALAALEAGNAPTAKRILQSLCHNIPPVPPFEIV